MVRYQVFNSILKSEKKFQSNENFKLFYHLRLCQNSRFAAIFGVCYSLFIKQVPFDKIKLRNILWYCNDYLFSECNNSVKGTTKIDLFLRASWKARKLKYLSCLFNLLEPLVEIGCWLNSIILFFRKQSNLSFQLFDGECR